MEFGLPPGTAGPARGEVQIIGERPSGQPVQNEERPLLTPASPSPSLDSPVTGGMAVPLPQAVSPDEKVPASPLPPSTPESVGGQIWNSGNGNIADQLNSAVQSHKIKILNPAGLSVQIISGSMVGIGDLISFQISSRKAGYLILVDVDAGGKLTQIYPSAISLVEQGIDKNINRLEPDNAPHSPDRDNVQTALELLVSAPPGIAMVVAMLSDRSVQLVDLPDIPASLLGSAEAVDYLTKQVNELRINGEKKLEVAHWSFDVKFYSIR